MEQTLPPPSPAPPPVPVLPLHSRQVMVEARPPMLTAIAAMSIVLACVGIAINLVQALPAVIMTVVGSGNLGELLLSPVSLWYVEAATWIGLATYLFVAGVLLLSGKPSACRHHRRYALWKIVIVAVLTAATWPQGSFVAKYLSSEAPSAGMALRTLRLTALSLAYPVFLLFAMNTRGVREYDR
jgi:hypothetical protein